MINRSSVSFIRVLCDLFPAKEMWLLVAVLAIAIVAAVFQTLGVASILPFMTLVLDPASLSRYPMVTSIAAMAGITSQRDAVLFLGLMTVLVVAVGNATGAISIITQERFSARTSVRLAMALVGGYLAQPYSFHVGRDAPSLMKTVLSDVRFVVGAVITPLLLALSRIFVAGGLLILLFLQDPAVALTMGIVLGLAYWLVFRHVRVRQRRLGHEMNDANLHRQRILQEGFGGVKDLQVLGRERHVLTRFHAETVYAANAESSNRIVGALPRYVLETVGFGGILLVTLALLSGPDNEASKVVPILALYAFAAYRLLPALQQIFTSAVTIRFHQPVLRSLHADFSAVATLNSALTKSWPEDQECINFRDAICLNGVSFSYAGAQRPSLRDVDLTIRSRETIALVGRTGSGKTTLADLILGLYEPTGGTLTVDGVPLNGTRVRAWRRRVGYVSQHVFLANASVLENIAFALPRDEIDEQAVRRSAVLAQAEQFINALPDGFETIVGERGVKLSGGQRQRLGIARALYHDPEVIVFDEATSALDGLTEDAVMDAIRSLSGHRTIILIAHRMRTVEACDRIVLLEDGQKLADGSYSALLKTSEHFRSLVSRSSNDGREAA